MAAGQAVGPRPTPRNGRSLSTMKAGRISAAARKPTGAASWIASSTRPGPRQDKSTGAASGETPAPRPSSRCRLTATVPSLREAFCDEIPDVADDFLSRFAGSRIDAAAGTLADGLPQVARRDLQERLFELDRESRSLNS